MIEILIPHFGDESLLHAAVASVLAQSDPRWHLKIIDDLPTPSVRAWASELPVKTVSYEANAVRLGVAGNFQRCLDRASADWVVFMGCDDLLHTQYVARIHELLVDFPETTAIQPAVNIIDEHGKRILPLVDRVKRSLSPAGAVPTLLGGERLLTSLLNGNWTYFPAIAWRREVIAKIGFRQDLDTALDLALLAAVVLTGGELLTDTEVAFAYRRHGASASSLTAASSERFVEERRLFAELARDSDSVGWSRAARAARSHLTSRAHAATLIPKAMHDRDGPLVSALARHAFREWR